VISAKEIVEITALRKKRRALYSWFNEASKLPTTPNRAEGSKRDRKLQKINFRLFELTNNKIYLL
tara:strand:- start:8540 stop:8734 length:195 start_codon:yes stop_codon:yes gene_type:complete